MLTLKLRQRSRDAFIRRIDSNRHIASTVLVRKLRTSVLFESVHADRLQAVMAIANTFPGVMAVVQTKADYVEVAF